MKVTKRSFTSAWNHCVEQSMTSITFAPAHVNLPIRVPHLMPFHINHTGPAPVSTYFRIRPVPLAPASSETHPASAATLEESGSQLPNNTYATGTSGVSLEDRENGPVAITVSAAAAEADPVATASTSCVLRPGPIQRLSESAKRFISSFRGRTVHGVDVALPTGYTGIILRGDSDGDRRQMARCKTKRWSTWQARGNPVGGRLDDTSEMLSDEEEDRPVRTLKPAARFDSFVLWHPDVPVDEGKDEYLRSLSEWVNIAAEVCVLVTVLPSLPSGDHVQNRSIKANDSQRNCTSRLDYCCIS